MNFRLAVVLFRIATAALSVYSCCASSLRFTLTNHAVQLAAPFGLVRLSGRPERFVAWDGPIQRDA